MGRSLREHPPSEYAVNIETRKGKKAAIKEDETGVWIEGRQRRNLLDRESPKTAQF